MSNISTAETVAMAAINKWGTAAQWLMCLEEMSELAVNITHHMRGREVTDEAMAEEIADVQIMMLQASHMIGRERVSQIYNAKMARLRAKLGLK